MPTFEIKMPKLGESITEGVIISWSVKVGDTIEEDDVLFEVNTAKVSAEIPSPVAGKILEILFQEGDTVPVGTVVAKVELEGEDAGDSAASPAQETPKASEAQAAPEKKEASATEVAAPAKKNKEEGRWYSPVVTQLAKEAKISQDELDKIAGTGYEGRLSKKDITKYIDQTKNGVVPTPGAAKPAASAAPTQSAPAAAPAPKPAIPVAEGDKVIPMDFVGKIVADRMVESVRTSPHVTTIVEVDVTKLVKWRTKNKDAFQKREGISLTYLPAITEAVAKALIDFPRINSSLDGYNIIEKKRINIGIAVSLPDGNLIVPVIKDADKMNLTGLATSIDALALKARNNKLSGDDIQGGTFTITNFGSFKNIIGTPIINQPEVAILGAGIIEKKPAVISTPDGDVIAIRHKMYLSLSYDHRVINGALGGAFVRRIADYLENWEA
ncbi:2-oxoglutarate dehydrogenase E2 component (dihydrolipoamide succinyltransferase) [Dysgonomonas alginatilytica]|uniref:Dihydrolipoamide acetyltransferase component of pyruvate dehydrogenase complex n=1 Tax=Dysgonomonas alginatilytica TaxID=1605892 RepID=A0A2V3PSX8_9BACT|nr:dihydrolipoamide acetyltransferase family protein [Dysgonomonas alginatilytica]PXV66275.1 2-oxoglutarate dehydrogenase E2 component (dihydrolipoamide succinyltransferase) [Dysgonomonas alginatilytica]